MRILQPSAFSYTPRLAHGGLAPFSDIWSGRSGHLFGYLWDLRYTEDGACRSQVVKLNETQTKAAHWRGWMGANNALLWGFNDLGRE